MSDDDEQRRLVDALDRWFGIIRDESNATVPLKPVKPSLLDRLANELEVDLPPDVVTLFEYTNGAWSDRDRLIEGWFLPSGFTFYPLVGGKGYRHNGKSYFGSFSRMWDGSPRGAAETEFSGVGWANDIPLFEKDMSQVSIQAGPRCFQACSVLDLEGMHWIGRRLADVFENAIALYEQGYIETEAFPYFKMHYPDQVQGVPWDLEKFTDENGAFRYPGWIWEELPPITPEQQ